MGFLMFLSFLYLCSAHTQSGDRGTIESHPGRNQERRLWGTSGADGEGGRVRFIGRERSFGFEEVGMGGGDVEKGRSAGSAPTPWKFPQTWEDADMGLGCLAGILTFINFLMKCCASVKERMAVNGKVEMRDSEGAIGRADPSTLYFKGTDEAGFLVTPFPEENCFTGHALIQRAFSKFSHLKGPGHREFKGWHKPEGVRFPLKKFGKTTWRTYKDLQERCRALGAALVKKCGMVPLPAGTRYEDVSTPGTVLIYEETCEAWVTMLFGAWSQSLCVATSYATMGAAAVKEAVDEASVSVIMCNMKAVKSIISDVTSPCLKHVIYTTNYCTAEEIAAFKEEASAGFRIPVHNVDDLIEEGMFLVAETEMVAPEPSTMAVLMYTSGSTGKPKGVMLSHKAITADVAGKLDRSMWVLKEATEDFQEVYLGYLPAAHIMELTAQIIFYSIGAKIGYADPKSISSKGAVRELDNGTLVTAAVEDVNAMEETAPGAIQCFRPTLLIAVPKIWDILKKGVEENVGAKGGTVQTLISWAYLKRKEALETNTAAPLADKLFQKIANVIGGRCKFALTGAGPCSQEVQDTVRTAFMMPLVQGYGLTETVAGATIQFPDDMRSGITGPPLGSAEVKLVDAVEEGTSIPINDREKKPYKCTDTEHMGEPCVGRGEVCIRGPAVADGYYKLPEKTAEVFKSDGWFHTGDVGIWLPDGTLKIVDRVKNLIKLKGGEYIALESMEKEYSTSVYVNGVAGGLVCYGDGTMDRPVALVQANIPAIRKWAKESGLDPEGTLKSDELCKNQDVLDMVLADLHVAHKTGGLGVNEKLKAIALLPGSGEETDKDWKAPWTPANEFLTASNKINRRPIYEALEDLLTPLKALATV